MLLTHFNSIIRTIDETKAQNDVTHTTEIVFYIFTVLNTSGVIGVCALENSVILLNSRYEQRKWKINTHSEREREEFVDFFCFVICNYFSKHSILTSNLCLHHWERIQHQLIDNLSIFKKATTPFQMSIFIGKRFSDGFDKMRSGEIYIKFWPFYNGTATSTVAQTHNNKSENAATCKFTFFSVSLSIKISNGTHTAYLDTSQCVERFSSFQNWM